MNSMAFVQRSPKDFIAFSNLGYDYHTKEQFHRQAKAFLRDLAKALGLSDNSYDIRSNKGGDAVSGEVTLHADALYVQLSESCVGARGVHALIRSCRSRKDYTGGTNHWIPLAPLSERSAREAFLSQCKSLMETYK